MKKLNIKRGIWVTVLAIIVLLSIFVISPLVSSPEFHSKSIQTLDDKKISVLKISTAAVGISTGLAAFPGDATTPIANQILNLSSYLIIVIGAIFLEKLLLTITGYISFTYIIPISCVLFGIYLYIKNDMIRNLAIKLCTFGIVLFLIVPISLKVSELVENTCQSTINQTIEDAESIENMAEANTSEQETSEEESGWSGLTSKVKDGISTIGNNIEKIKEKGERALNNLIDSIAVWIITCCVIPIAVIIIFVLIIKSIFSVTIPTTKLRKIGRKEVE